MNPVRNKRILVEREIIIKALGLGKEVSNGVKRYQYKSKRRSYGSRDRKLNLPRVKRLCLACERIFLAYGLFNRICPKCKQIQRQEGHAVRWGGRNDATL